MRQQTFAQEGTGAAASGMYMPLTVEIGRMYSGDWFGEETLLGTTASGMPWSVVVDSSEADLLTLHAADFFSTLNEDKFPGLLAYLKEVSYLKQVGAIHSSAVTLGRLTLPNRRGLCSSSQTANA